MIKALLLIICSGQVMAADVPGRLFYSPQQRAAKQHQVEKPNVSTTVYQGYVERSDGVNTQWVNGKVRMVGVQSNMLLKQNGVPTLKPGQRYDAQRRKVQESYEQVAQMPELTVAPWQPPQMDKPDAADSLQ